MTSFPGMPNENVLKIDQGVLVAGKQASQYCRGLLKGVLLQDNADNKTTT